MLYQMVNGAVKFAADTIIENINFVIKNTEKIAIVGRNGCGKSTLLRLIAGEIDLSKRDSDEHIYIIKSGQPQIGYLKQMTFDDESITLEEEVDRVFEPVLTLKQELDEALQKLEEDPSEKNVLRYSELHDEFEIMDGYNYKKDYDIILTKFGFSLDDKKKKLSEFSGGQKTKISFVKLLLSKPDILLLDEPTNHLDMSTTQWLEKYLKSYPKAVVIVSHDRMFLDNIVSVVYEIEYKTSKRYPGNYTYFCDTKRENWNLQMKKHIHQQKEIKRLKDLVERFKNKPSKVAMTRSKLKQIEHMEIIQAPDQYDMKTFHSNFTPTRQGSKEVLRVNLLEIGYGDVLSEVDLLVNKGQKLGILGDNGTGKSTFLKTIVDLVPALGGHFQFGYQIDVGYFDQNSIKQTGNKTVLDEFWDEFPTLTQSEIRSSLGAFLFRQDEVFKTMDMLSGGERARLALCKILKRKPNLLILDEPTNHMDIVGKETLEILLKEYHGTVIFVSHDRYFVSQVADSILAFEEGVTKSYPYGFEQYLEEKDKTKKNDNLTEVQDNRVAKMTTKKEKREKYISPEKQKEIDDKKIKDLEEELDSIHVQISELDEKLLDPELSSDYGRLKELYDQKTSLVDEQESLMNQWVELS